MPSYHVEFAGVIVADNEDAANVLAERVAKNSADEYGAEPGVPAALALMSVEVVVPKRARVIS
jgi:hypothetical protein